MKNIKIKLMLIFGLVLSLFYFTSDFALIDIEKTAIVVAIAIDKEDQDYKVTAQIAIPQASDTAASNDDAVMQAKGKTVMDAINRIGSETGWHPKLSFCSMIFISREVAVEEVSPIVEYLLASPRLQNSAIIAMSDDKAEELLYAKTPLDAISSFALQKIVLKNEWSVSTVGVTNLKKFAMMQYSKSKSAYMPVIKIVEGQNKPKDENSDAQQTATGTGGSAGSGNGGGDSEADVIFNSASSAVFLDGKLVTEITDEETSVYYLFQGPVAETFMTVEAGGKQHFVTVNSNDYKVTVNTKGKPTINLKLTLKVETNDSTGFSNLKRMTNHAAVPDDVLKALEEKIKKITQSLMKKLLSANGDIFMIKEYIYKYENADYERLKDVPLSSFNIKTDITVLSSD